MEPIRITLKDHAGLVRSNEPVGLGIPLPVGALKDTSELTLSSQKEPAPVPFQAKALASWPDGSIRWVHISFFATLEAGAHTSLLLEKAIPEASGMNITTEQLNGSLVITTPAVNYTLHANSLAWDSTNTNDVASQSKVVLKDEDLGCCEFISSENWQVIEAGPVTTTVKQTGAFKRSDGSDLLRVTCELSIYSANGLMEVSVTPHNPKRASHPGGLWDLGDKGSVFFRGLNVETTFPEDGGITLVSGETENSKTVTSDQSAGIYQDSSGGVNWDSPNHVDRFGKVTTRFRGYRLSKEGQNISEGLRANPNLTWKAKGLCFQTAIPRFWENFPTSLYGEQRKVIAGLFPEDSGQLYELQGGERKRLTLFVSHSDQNPDLSWVYTPLTPVIDASVYETADAFPWFRANQPAGPLDELISLGLDGPNNFFEKREQIDEYGWRNFGDIFADHETLYQPEGEPPLVSHYNNQYDAIYGFARQFALTGDSRWFELMDDLARHVVDIDIYHTDEDRAEYNNGLFWHTDHYLPAHTATHRTFTRHNDTSSTPGQTGGGPAAEHCYTTGLLYHYLLTGAPASKTAVLDLAQWMVNLHEAPAGLLAQLLALKKQELPKLKALIKGEQPSPHRYPFTRGTGNYLTALLDAAVLEPEGNWLRKAEQVIRDTIHPGDDIERRNLLDVELGWSYLILLASIARFLNLKRKYGDTNIQFSYAKSAFMHYVNWMLNNERLFLSCPEQLEFPNDTWLAQDIRKSMLMFHAAELQPNSGRFRDKGNQWMNEICNTLGKSTERHYARILIILMQNYGPHQPDPSTIGAQRNTALPSEKDKKPPGLSWGKLLGRVVVRIVRGIRTFRPAKEYAWIQARLNRT